MSEDNVKVFLKGCCYLCGSVIVEEGFHLGNEVLCKEECVRSLSRSRRKERRLRMRGLIASVKREERKAGIQSVDRAGKEPETEYTAKSDREIQRLWGLVKKEGDNGLRLWKENQGLREENAVLKNAIDGQFAVMEAEFAEDEPLEDAKTLCVKNYNLAKRIAELQKELESLREKLDKMTERAKVVSLKLDNANAELEALRGKL